MGNAGTNQGQYIFGCFEHYINKAEDWWYVVVCGCVNSSRWTLHMSIWETTSTTISEKHYLYIYICGVRC